MNRAPELPAGTVPAGATHFYHDPSRLKPGTQAWRKQEGGKWYMFADGEWRVIKGSNAHMFVPIEQVLRPAWTGEGLPPVGTVCEYRADGWPHDQWEVRTVMYVSAYHVITQEEDGTERRVDGEKAKFRPICTAEQIAAKERSKACDEMFGVILSIPEENRHNRSDICEALYDAGYRKQVQP